MPASFNASSAAASANRCEREANLRCFPFAKTDGSWWTANQDIWSRVQQADRNDRLDYHHSSFGSVNQAKGPATSISPWCVADD